MDNQLDDECPLPPRREKHGSKKDITDIITDNHKNPGEPQSFHNIQAKINSRYARRKALREFTLNPQGYMHKSTEPKNNVKQTKEKKKKKKWSGGLITANIILCLFLLLIGGIFFFIVYYY